MAVHALEGELEEEGLYGEDDTEVEGGVAADDLCDGTEVQDLEESVVDGEDIWGDATVIAAAGLADDIFLEIPEGCFAGLDGGVGAVGVAADSLFDSWGGLEGESLKFMEELDEVLLMGPGVCPDAAAGPSTALPSVSGSVSRQRSAGIPAAGAVVVEAEVCIGGGVQCLAF